MSVRVVARIRPLLKSELDKDSIVEAASTTASVDPTIVRIPNPKNASETFSFQFNSVYDQTASQQVVFDNEVSPTVKHLFGGFDVTIFAYGVTGTGKTHTMRGGKLLADRGVIPRLLSAIYRRARKVEKDSGGDTKVEVTMSYYEIYCDRVFDLFEPQEKRTPAGLPIRDNNGKTVVAGLTERPCSSLKEFETLYDQANVNRSTSATKLNAHSSRSHAILCVKLSQTTGDHVMISTASAIDLAGSEDNRRTENGKERLVESSSINKSLFVLAQCVEAISKKQARIPYRESKMTRILSLGQNNGLTIMILNLAPVRSYHLDTLSSLNFANRTKKIEVREIENEPIFKGAPKTTASILGTSNRQPLRPLPSAGNLAIAPVTVAGSKPPKAFSVYADKSRFMKSSEFSRRDSLKRRSGSDQVGSARPMKIMRPNNMFEPIRRPQLEMSKASIEEMIDRLVEEKLAARALNDTNHTTAQPTSEELQRRLDSLEQRVGKTEDERAEGLQYLLMAKEHHVRGEDTSALRMYQLAMPYFPKNEKLAQKVASLQYKLDPKHQVQQDVSCAESTSRSKDCRVERCNNENNDDDYRPDQADEGNFSDEDEFRFKPKSRKLKATKLNIFMDSHRHPIDGSLTPRSSHLLNIINTRDTAQIRLLKGVGPKKAEAIVSCLCSLDNGEEGAFLEDLDQLGALRGVGSKMVENMRSGIAV